MRRQSKKAINQVNLSAPDEIFTAYKNAGFEVKIIGTRMFIRLTNRNISKSEAADVIKCDDYMTKFKMASNGYLEVIF